VRFLSEAPNRRPEWRNLIQRSKNRIPTHSALESSRLPTEKESVRFHNYALDFTYCRITRDSLGVSDLTEPHSKQKIL
jgi:hypothetical protein